MIWDGMTLVLWAANIMTPLILMLLANQGLVFTQGYAASANCAPSRASIHSGKWTTRHQIYTVANSDRGKASDRKLIPIKNTRVLDKKFTTLSQN